MEKSFELEVGNISSNLFQLITVNAINDSFCLNERIKEKDEYIEIREKLKETLSVNLISEQQINVILIDNFPHQVDHYIYKILYSKPKIVVFSEVQYFYDLDISREDAEKVAIENLDSNNKLLETSFVIQIKNKQPEMIDVILKNAFNPVSCFSTKAGSVSIENLRLTPFCQIIKKDSEYREIPTTRHILLTPPSDKAREEKIFIVRAVSQDKHGLGQSYSLAPPFYHIGDNMYVSVQEAFSSEGLDINRIYAAENESNPEDMHWIYFSTHGIIFDNLLIKAPITAKNKDDGHFESISYSTGNTSVEVQLHFERLSEDDYKNTEKVPVTVSVIGSNKNETTNLIINPEEDLSKYEQCQEFLDIKTLISKLGTDKNYFDGKSFVKLLTKETIQREKEEADRIKWEKEHPTSAFFQNHGKQILVVAGIIIFLIIILAGC